MEGQASNNDLNELHHDVPANNILSPTGSSAKLESHLRPVIDSEVRRSESCLNGRTRVCKSFEMTDSLFFFLIGD